MNVNLKLAALSGLALCGMGAAALAEPASTPKTAQQHIDRALSLAGKSYMTTTAKLQCGLSGPAMGMFGDKTVPEPTQLFDNFYYVGLTPVGAYAIKTRDGIILIDALNTSEDAEKVIEPGLRKFGLDPAQVKYVIVTHGHGDHFGGARYFAEKYGAHVMMSEADWNLVANPPARPAGPAGAPPRFGKPPAKDLVAEDGLMFEFGGQRIQITVTPGHTPGTISLIVPVTVKGAKHVLAMWGGTGVPRDAKGREAYIASAAKFDAVARKAGADIELSNHPFVDESLTRMAQLRSAPAKPNPFVIGSAAYGRYSAIISECAKAVAAGGPTAS